MSSNGWKRGVRRVPRLGKLAVGLLTLAATNTGRAQWDSNAYPWASISLLPTASVKTIYRATAGAPNALLPPGYTTGYFAVRAQFNPTNSVFTGTNFSLQARDVWNFDGFSAAAERAIPTGGDAWNPVAFPFWNFEALCSVKQWIHTNAAAFVNPQEFRTNSLNNYFATNAAAGTPVVSAPMLTAEELYRQIGAPTNLNRYTPVWNRAPNLGRVVTSAVRLAWSFGQTNGTVTNRFCDPWGPRDFTVSGHGVTGGTQDCQNITGTNGQVVSVVWTSAVIYGAFTADDYNWKYVRAAFTTLTTTASTLEPWQSVSNEVGGGSARPWSTDYCGGIVAQRGDPLLTFGRGAFEPLPATNCANQTDMWHWQHICTNDAEMPYAWRSVGGSEHHAFVITTQDCSIGLFSGYQITVSNLLGDASAAEAAANCLCAADKTVSNWWVACNAYPVGSGTTNEFDLGDLNCIPSNTYQQGQVIDFGGGKIRLICQFSQSTNCLAEQQHVVETITQYLGGDCTGQVSTVTTSIYDIVCGTITNLADYCTNKTSITSTRRSHGIVVPPANYPLGQFAITPNQWNPWQWLWSTWATGRTVETQTYLQFYVPPEKSNFTYTAECGAAAATNSALTMYSTITNGVHSNLVLILNAGKSGNIDLIPMACTNVPFDTLCTPTNVGWWIKGDAAAVHRWGFQWR